MADETKNIEQGKLAIDEEYALYTERGIAELQRIANGEIVRHPDTGIQWTLDKKIVALQNDLNAQPKDIEKTQAQNPEEELALYEFGPERKFLITLLEEAERLKTEQSSEKSTDKTT